MREGPHQPVDARAVAEEQPDLRGRAHGDGARPGTQALGEVQGATAEAVATLRRLLKAKLEGVQLRAAVEILANAIKARDSVELEDRLAALEAKVLGPGAALKAVRR